MSETKTILDDTARRLFSDRFGPDAMARAADGEWLDPEWRQLEALGLVTALVSTDPDELPPDPADVLGIVRLAGYHGVALPVAETLTASWLLARSDIAVPEGPLTFGILRTHAQTSEHGGGDRRLRGFMARVPWARHAVSIVALALVDDQWSLCLLDPSRYGVDPATNLAGEPRDDVSVDAQLGQVSVVPAPEGFGPAELRATGAAMRALAMAGAVDRVLDMSVAYAGERRQFGRPIGKFQAVQQNLAVLAGQAAAATAASDIAAESFTPNPALLQVAIAKVRTGEAAGLAASIAHQVHGAIGFTEEHSLHFFSKRLWSWRDEFGGEAEWNRVIGQEAAAAGPDGLWPLITAT